jgi:TetR/AcrR family transcriptional regulator of autoinduction and epiphytic fitness
MKAEEPVQTRLSEQRNDELLDIASEVFLEKGFDRASVGEMAKRANASKATYYTRYATKELLFSAIIRRKTDQVEEAFANIIRNDEEIENALKAFGERLLMLILLDDAVAIDRVISMEAQRFPELGKIFYEGGPGRMADLLTTYLRQKVSEGVLSISHHKLAAEQFIDMVTGFIVRRAVLGIGDRATAREKNQRVHAAVHVFLKAYQAK